MSDMFSERIVESSPVPQNSSTTEALGPVQVAQIEPTCSCHVSSWWSWFMWPVRCECLLSVSFSTKIECSEEFFLFDIFYDCHLSMQRKFICCFAHGHRLIRVKFFHAHSLIGNAWRLQGRLLLGRINIRLYLLKERLKYTYFTLV